MISLFLLMLNNYFKAFGVDGFVSDVDCLIGAMLVEIFFDMVIAILVGARKGI